MFPPLSKLPLQLSLEPRSPTPRPVPTTGSWARVARPGAALGPGLASRPILRTPTLGQKASPGAVEGRAWAGGTGVQALRLHGGCCPENPEYLGAGEPADLQAEGARAHPAAGAGHQGALAGAQPGGDAAEVGATGAIGRRVGKTMGGHGGSQSWGQKKEPPWQVHTKPASLCAHWVLRLPGTIATASALILPRTASPHSPLAHSPLQHLCSPCALPDLSWHLAHCPPPLGLSQMALPLAA